MADMMQMAAMLIDALARREQRQQTQKENQWKETEMGWKTDDRARQKVLQGREDLDWEAQAPWLKMNYENAAKQGSINRQRGEVALQSDKYDLSSRKYKDKMQAYNDWLANKWSEIMLNVDMAKDDDEAKDIVNNWRKNKPTYQQFEKNFLRTDATGSYFMIAPDADINYGGFEAIDEPGAFLGNRSQHYTNPLAGVVKLLGSLGTQSPTGGTNSNRYSPSGRPYGTRFGG